MSRRALAAGVALASLLSVGVVAAQDPPAVATLPAIVPGATVTGTIDAPSERDAYALTIDPTVPASLLDVRLIAPSGPARRVCLDAPDPTVGLGWTSLACASGTGAAVLRDLLLPPGEYQLVVAGDPAPDIYALIVDRTSAPKVDHETEPNDTPVLATPWDAETVLHGWHEQDDVDHVALRTTGEPQRWRLALAGDGIVGFIQLKVTSALLAIAGEDDDGTWVFPDVYLAPGDHLLRVSTSGVGPYTLTATPLGPPDPDEELEPNDVEAEPLPVGTTRFGRLASTSDVDRFRFSVAADDHIRVRVEPPADGGMYVVLESSTEQVAYGQSDGLGAAVQLEHVLPPDDYLLRVSATGPSADRYRLELVREDPFADIAPRPALPVELDLRTDGRDVAAFWPKGQEVAANLTVVNPGTSPAELAVDARTSDQRWAAVPARETITVAAGGTETVPMSIRVPSDASRVPVRITVRARDTSGAQATAFVEVTPVRDAPPTRERQAWSVPDELLGGIDVAALGAGAMPIVSIDEAGERALHDGVAHTLGGFRVVAAPPLTLTVDLAGDAPIPIAGMLLNPVAMSGGATGVPREVELLLSEDGVAWQSALTGTLSSASIEQAFVLPAPVTARFAQLRIGSTWGPPGTIQLGEWKVVAVPGLMPGAAPVDLADPGLGGQIAWMEPQPGSWLISQGVLRGDLTRPPPWAVYERGSLRSVTWVVTFQDGRAARVTSLGWEDALASIPADRLKSVDVAISEFGPAGPWQDVGTWKLRRAKDGSVAPFELDDAPWARAVRFRGAMPHKDGVYVELPARLHIFERTPDATSYRSITGQWGDGVRDGPREWGGGDAAGPVGSDDLGNHDASSAMPLQEGSLSHGRVQRDVVEDWYSVIMPDGQRTLLLELTGTPYVGAAVDVRTADGTPVPLVDERPTVDAGVVLAAAVEPGATYLVRVHQPRLSAVISLDTSVSIDLEPVTQALDAYARDIVEGEESVQLMPFTSEPLLPTWSDDRWEVADGLRRLVPSGSSAVEDGLIDAAELLRTRDGNRAILLLTDAETSSFMRQTEAWQALRAVGPMIFPVHVGGMMTPVWNRHTLQDLAGIGPSWYTYASSRSAIDVAFDRMATWLRRPAAYGLRWTSSSEELAPPEPGSLSVVAPAGADGSPGAAIDPSIAVEIILDTSGSMLDRFGGRSRIDVAKRVLRDLVTEHLPEGAAVTVRILGDRDDICGTELLVPLDSLDPEAVVSLVNGLRVDRQADTPIGAAIAAVSQDLADATGTRIVLLITDSKEIWPHRDLCGVDPADAIQGLIDQGIDVRVNIVGMAVDDRRARRQLTGWARGGNGEYFDARNARQLGDAIRAAITAPFQVYDASGAIVARGTVDGPAVSLAPGTYRVVVRTDPEQVFEDVLVEEGASPTLELSGG